MAQVGDVLGEALKLPAEERAALAAHLIASLEASEPAEEVERAWADEIQRRVAALDAGNVELIPWEQARARISARLKQRA
jgi:putative addiction module component (TIGR02574 family)